MIIDTNKIKNFLKEKINSIKIPKVVDIIVNKPVDEIIKNAPDAKNNWERLGLNKTWLYFIPVIVVPTLYLGRNAIMFFIDIIFKGAALIPFGIVLWFLWKKIKNPKGK